MGEISVNNCPNCNNEICANGFMTHMVSVMDLMTNPNQLEMMLVDETFLSEEYFLNNDYPDKLRKPRVLPAVISKRLPDISDFEFFNQESFQAVSITCKNTPWIFQYTDSFVDVEVFDN